YLPHALLNYLVRLGWSHGDQEIFSIEEMQSLFDLKDVNAKASRLDSAKLGWLNQQYLKSDDPAAVAKHLEWHLQQAGCDLANGPAPADVVVALRDRVQTLKDMAERAVVWFRPLEQYDDKAVAKHLKPEAAAPLRDMREPLAALPACAARALAPSVPAPVATAPLRDMRDRRAALPAWTAGAIDAALHATVEPLGLGMGKLAQPLRVAITGTQVSPDIAQTIYLAGRDAALQRIDAAIAKIPAAAG